MQKKQKNKPSLHRHSVDFLTFWIVVLSLSVTCSSFRKILLTAKMKETPKQLL